MIDTVQRLRGVALEAVNWISMEEVPLGTSVMGLIAGYMLSRAFISIRQIRQAVGRTGECPPLFRSDFIRNSEPPLDEVMADPMVRSLMARDGVAFTSVETLIAETRRRLVI